MSNEFVDSKCILCEVTMLSSRTPNMLNVGDILVLATMPLLHVSTEFIGTSFAVVSSSSDDDDDDDDSSFSSSTHVELLP